MTNIFYFQQFVKSKNAALAQTSMDLNKEEKVEEDSLEEPSVLDRFKAKKKR